jgi:hypothetical protein
MVRLLIEVASFLEQDARFGPPVALERDRRAGQGKPHH